MRSLVTGGCGFIGSHLVDRLIEMGHDVIVIDNESSISNSQFYKNSKATYHKLDVSDYDSTRFLYDDIDYVFHLAAESRIQPTIDNPLLAMKTNVLGTGTVLQCSREANVKKIMYSSTSSGYGLINDPPLDETMPDDCLNPYSVTKISGEKMCTMYTKLFGLKTVIFRYFNVYGEREPIRGPYAPVTGIFLRQFAAGETLTVTEPGTQRRDFVHVSDVVKANILAMTNDNHERYGEIFNVGTGVNYSIIQLANMISDDIKMIDSRPGEALITLANNDKIKNTFDWEPTVSLDEHIRKKL